jgi:hypothetical protein
LPFPRRLSRHRAEPANPKICEAGYSRRPTSTTKLQCTTGRSFGSGSAHYGFRASRKDTSPVHSSFSATLRWFDRQLSQSANRRDEPSAR